MSSDDFIYFLFKKVKFTRGKKQERILSIKNIKQVFNSNCKNNDVCIKANTIFSHIEAIFNDRSVFKGLTNYEQIIIIFILFSCDFNGSVQVTDEDFKYLFDNKHCLVDLTSFTLAYNIISCCPTVKNILSPNWVYC